MGTFTIGRNQQVVQGIPVGKINDLSTRVKALEDGGASVSQTYETLLRNLSTYPAAVTYTADNKIDTVVYTLPAGSITETVSYTGSNVSSITLSGDTPAGADLVKTFGYSGNNITSVTYS